MIVVTGGAGFIGSNIVKGLNENGESNVLVVDDLRDGTKFKNIVDCDVADYIDYQDFIDTIVSNPMAFGTLTAIFHEGACSSTTEWDGRYMMRNNYEYSKRLLHHCLEHQTPYLYASSAAVYGSSTVFREDKRYEQPLNVYGYSKFLFDQYVRRLFPSIKSQVVGFRYFNVYGPHEQHKGSMSSVAYHLNNQVKSNSVAQLFEGNDGYDDGEQRRDFVYVKDVVDVNFWFLKNPEKVGIYNLGSGRSQPFNDVARAVIDYHGHGDIEYIPFPEHLQGCYQSYTEADISLLRKAGYAAPFKSVEQGVHEYMQWLNK